MRTKTTNGETEVIASDQDCRTLDRAIDVLEEYSYRVQDATSAANASEAAAVVRKIVKELADVETDKPVRSSSG
jgi:hypothetical protein